MSRKTLASLLMTLGALILVAVFIYKDQTVDVGDNGFVSVPSLERFFSNEELSEEEKARLLTQQQEIIKKIEENPEIYQYWLELASHRKLAGDYKGAEEIWLYVNEKWPNYRVVYENLGGLYHFYLKDYAKAEENFKKAIELDPAYPIGYKNLFDLYTLSYTKKQKRAETVLLDGLEHLPDDLGIIFTLADYYESKGNTSKAIDMYKRLLNTAVLTRDVYATGVAQEALNRL
jgi:tetratricopeptide (TPR) repeat protein